MLSTSSINVDSIVNFSIYPVATFGANFNNVKIKAIIDADIAIALGYNVAQLHAIVYPTLPQDTPNDYRGYQYILITNASNQRQIFGIPWIVDSSYNEVGNQTMTIIIDNVSPDDQIKIQKALSSNGYTALKITLSNS